MMITRVLQYFTAVLVGILPAGRRKAVLASI